MGAKTATLGQIIGKLTALAETESRETPVFLVDEDTGWFLEVDPGDFIAPNRTDDGAILLRSIGYHGLIGEARGEVRN